VAFISQVRAQAVEAAAPAENAARFPQPLGRRCASPTATTASTTTGSGSYTTSGDTTRRGELIERSFAHSYETGGLRRTHLRGHSNILKRLLIHLAGFNLSLVMRQALGVGTPRGLQGRLAALAALLRHWIGRLRPPRRHRSVPALSLQLLGARFDRALAGGLRLGEPRYTTGC